MPTITFPSGLYEAADWDFTNPVEFPAGALQQIFMGAHNRMLDALHRSYYNAVDIYQVASRSERWIDETPLETFGMVSGKVYVTLDYFTACLPLPWRMRRLGAKKEAVLAEYVGWRGLENVKTNAESLLRGLATSCQIPDEWFPEKELAKRVEKEIRRTGYYRQVEVEFDLRIPPGGLGWLSEVTVQTVATVREKLALGQPWPVRLVCSPIRMENNRQVIVYACQEQKGGKLRLEIFEPGCVEPEHALQVVTRNNRVQVTEILGPEKHLGVLGLLYDDYTPAPVPPECIPWWLEWEEARPMWIGMLAWMQKKKLLRFF